jgi:hypothetical protein
MFYNIRKLNESPRETRMKATIEYLLNGKLVAVSGEIESTDHFSVSDGEAFAFLNPTPTSYRDVLTAATFGVSFTAPFTFEEALAELLEGVKATEEIEARHQGLRTDVEKRLEPEIRKKAENWKLGKD